MRLLLILILGLVGTTGLTQTDIPAKDKLEAVSVASEQASDADVTAQLDYLLLDFELIRSSGFNNGTKIISNESLVEMKSITEEVKTLSPDSYASEYLQFKEAGFTEHGLSHLIKAEKITFNKSELYSDFLATAHILKKDDLLDTYSTLLKNSGFLNQEVLEYNKNILRSFSEPNVLLVTNGWEDTYPLLTLLKQENKKATTVVNIEWIYDENYRASLSQQLGKPSSAFSNNPYSWINNMTKDASSVVYYTPTMPNSELLKLQNELIPIGLVFRRGALNGEEQKQYNLAAWKKFSKLNITSSNPLNKNYIIMLTMLEQQIAKDTNEKGTLNQVTATKKALISKHPSLK